MDESTRAEYARLMNGRECPKEFRCAEASAGGPCGAVDIGLESFARCLESEGWSCPMSVQYGGDVWCHCPVRVALAKGALA